MSKEKKGAVAGKILPIVLKQYEAVVAGSSALIYKFISTNKMQVVRDLRATLDAGQKVGQINSIRPAYATQFLLAGYVIELLGEKTLPANVAVFMKEVEVFHRSFGAKIAVEKASACKTWAQFVSMGRKAESKKKIEKARKEQENGTAGKNSLKGKKGGTQSVPVTEMKGELVIPDTLAKALDADALILFFVNRMQSLEGNALIAKDKVLASKAISILNHALNTRVVPKGAKAPKGASAGTIGNPKVVVNA